MKWTSAMSSLLNISAFLQARGREGGVERPLSVPISPRNPQPARWRGRSFLVARPLPLAQRGVEGLPVGALQVVVVEVLELWRRGRLGALLELQRVLLAVGSGGGGVAVGDVGVGAGRVKFCSHLPLQGQGHYLIASWHLAVWPRALFGLL